MISSSKVLVITGGSSGIGKATAQLFAEKGFKVYEISRSGSSEEGITHIKGDVSDQASMEEAFIALRQQESKIDVLINNAGFGISGAIENTTLTLAQKQLDVNFFGMVRTTLLALEMVKKSKGIIINLSSVAGVLPIPFQGFYSASKSAINSLTAALHNELKPFSVRVCCLMPGDIKTNFTAKRVKVEQIGGGYGDRIERSVKGMEKDEQQGMSAQFIANQLYKLSGKKRLKPLYVAGFKYKFFVWLSKTLPQGLVSKILYEMYAK